MNENLIIISVGGSLIVPKEIDLDFLKSLKKVVLDYPAKGKKFVIICGGGQTARVYQKAARSLSELNSKNLDWLGIEATRINAHLLRAIFYEWAHPDIIKNPLNKIDFKERILLAAGWKPGFSTDYDAVMLAKNLKIKKLINLTNIDYVYDKDPKKFKDAQPIKKISWENFRKPLPAKWDPGLNAPFDPVASKEAQKLGLEVTIINGKNLKSLENYLEEKDFIGTKIT